MAGFLRFKTAADLGRGFVRGAMRQGRFVQLHGRRFARGAKAHYGARGARKFRTRDGGIHYRAAPPGRAGGIGGFGKAQVKDEIRRGNVGRAKMISSGKVLAPYVGGAILGTAAAARGAQAYINWRRKVKEPTQYRAYDIYPEHGHAAVGVQPYNRPHYNDPERSGPPRHADARVGMYESERQALINLIIEAI